MNKGIITLLAIILVFVLVFASAHSQDNCEYSSAASASRPSCSRDCPRYR